MRIIIQEKDQEEILDLYNSGVKISDLCKKFDVPRNSIYAVLKKRGIEFSKDKPKHKDKIGKRYGDLIILDLIKGEDSRWYAKCKCLLCDKEFDSNIQNILRGSTRSCGCRKDHYHKISGANNKNWKGHGEIRASFFNNIKRKAKERRITFEIDIEEAWEIYLQQEKKCALSGIPIFFSVISKTKKQTTASLDRIDNSKGYVKGNVQWIHKDVNIMKNIYCQEYFVNICRSIANNKNNKNISCQKGLDVLKLKKIHHGESRDKL